MLSTKDGDASMKKLCKLLTGRDVQGGAAGNSLGGRVSRAEGGSPKRRVFLSRISGFAQVAQCLYPNEQTTSLQELLMLLEK